MKMLTKANIEQLKKNGLKQVPVKGTPQEIDFYPVVRLFTPDAQATWMLTEIDPEDSAWLHQPFRASHHSWKIRTTY